MRTSPLQLQHSQFAGLSLIASEQSAETSETFYPPINADDIKVEINVGVLADEPARGEYMLTIGVSNGEPPPTFPYRFAARIEGFFEIKSEEPKDDRKRLAVINGASMLYGIIREQLLNLSHRHKNGPLLLPSLDFRPLKERQKDEAPAAPKPKSTKAPRRKKTT